MKKIKETTIKPPSLCMMHARSIERGLCIVEFIVEFNHGTQYTFLNLHNGFPIIQEPMGVDTID